MLAFRPRKAVLLHSMATAGVLQVRHEASVSHHRRLHFNAAMLELHR